MSAPYIKYQATNPKRVGTEKECAILAERVKAEPTNEFINSILSQYQRSGGVLSNKQWAAVMKGHSAAKPVSTVAPPSVREPDFTATALVKLFHTAETHLRFPKIDIPGVNDLAGYKLHIYKSIKSPRYAGNYLCTNGKRQEAQIIYAVIKQNGDGFFNYGGLQRLPDTQALAMTALIEQMATKPTDTAKIHGIEYNHCCFCGLELTNKSSVYHGYGPICAERWGLPWGDLPEESLADLGQPTSGENDDVPF